MEKQLKPKYYQFYSDGKTVKELSTEEWRQLFNQDLKSKGDTHLLVTVWNSEIYFHKHHGQTISREQLRQVLGDAV